eukprot:SAG31_NODE_596_length_13674_cov_3.806409_6_plen_99_part_00
MPDGAEDPLLPAPQDKEWFARADWLDFHQQLILDATAAGGKCELVFLGAPRLCELQAFELPRDSSHCCFHQAIPSRKAGRVRVLRCGTISTKNITLST